MYDPLAPDFRDYMSSQEWIDNHGPDIADFELIKLYLEAEGFTVNFESSNRLFLQFSGTVGQFNTSFATVLHNCERVNPQSGNPPVDVYCTDDPLELPLFVTTRTRGIITADLPAATGALPPENIPSTTGPNNPGNGLFPDQLRNAYGGNDLMAMGYDGSGQNIGVIAGAHFHRLDTLAFWEASGIVRDDPVVIELMEPPVTRYIETHLDTGWSGAMAPGASLTVYEAPDSRNTSMIYGFNEAIARNEVDILTDSFAHREDSEPLLVRLAYDDAASMAAALGLTLFVASGDSARPDIPSTSPFVTAVGGTRVTLDNADEISNEVVWDGSGSGPALSIDLPYWQQGIVTGSGGKRATADISLNASPASGMWIFYLGSWAAWGGTSFSAPMMAGLMALVNERRADNALPRAGFLNPQVYGDTFVQSTFRDVTSGATDLYSAEVGWDYPTGWGSPDVAQLADALP
jgi:kumamolisin